MLIATFNVNSIRARIKILERWLNEIKPDLLFMQELKTADEFFPSEIFSQLGYKSYYHGEKRYNGVGVLIKDGILKENFSIEFGFTSCGSDELNDSDKNFVTRVLILRSKNLSVLNTYVPQGKEINTSEFEIKKIFLSRVKNFLASESIYENNFIWLGDMNVAPEPFDVKHPENKKNHVCYCDEIRKIYKDVRGGMVDIFRKFNQNSDEYTFYDYRYKQALEKKSGWRIDHILASPKIMPMFKNCYIDLRPRTWDKPSDHTPLIAELDI